MGPGYSRILWTHTRADSGYREAIACQIPPTAPGLKSATTADPPQKTAAKMCERGRISSVHRMPDSTYRPTPAAPTNQHPRVFYVRELFAAYPACCRRAFWEDPLISAPAPTPMDYFPSACCPSPGRILRDTFASQRTPRAPSRAPERTHRTIAPYPGGHLDGRTLN